MSELDQYHPGFNKLLHHLDHLKKIQNKETVSPIHLSVFPTNFCQLKCDYCCFGKTKRTNDELSFDDYKIAIDTLIKYGLKAVEKSGGGEPLLWSHFDKATEYAYHKGLNLSLVTNGLAIRLTNKETLSKYDWIRVSVQSAEYAEKIQLDKIPNNVKKSLSFIVYDNTTLEELYLLWKFASDNNIIVRVAPNRPCSKEWADTVLGKVKEIGYPLIGFSKDFGSPLGCYMAYIRASLDWNGNFLPCPSIELSPENAGKIPDTFAVCKAKDIEEWLKNNPPHDLGYKCEFCNCGKDTNDLIHVMMEDIGDVNFV